MIMEIQKIRKTASASPSGIDFGGKGSDSRPDNAFRSIYQEELREHYRTRAADLFDEISAQAPDIVARADLTEFEKYRERIGELLQSIVKNAYAVNSERLADPSRKNVVYRTIKIIDSKLENLASDLLDRNSSSISYLSRIDEIRGLVMDLLF
jgi:uncharacterized protein YaaR (DUF327 family)